MPNQTHSEIRQLESLRKQIFWWRTGATLVTVGVVASCLMGLNSSVRGLAEAGPRQDEFVGYMSDAMKKDIMPSVQSLASQTITEIQPQIRDEFSKLNNRVPELANATTAELKTLREELPKSSEKTLNAEFGELLKTREAKIRQMYPDVTEDQLRTFVANVQSSGEKELREANDELFAPHQAALASILDHMRTISTSASGETKGQDPTWEMGVAVLDVVREDLKSDDKGEGAKTVATTLGDADPKDGGKK